MKRRKSTDQERFFLSHRERKVIYLLCFLLLLLGFVFVGLNYRFRLRKESVRIIRDTVVIDYREPQKTPREEPLSDHVELPLPKRVPVQTPSAHGERASLETTPQEESKISGKFPKGTVVELNSADSSKLVRIPGIGPAYASWILRYRNRLGGFATVEQLLEVYRMDSSKYQQLRPWVMVQSQYVQPLSVNRSSFRELIRHPYLNEAQTKAIVNYRQRNGRFSSMEQLYFLEEFTEEDAARLAPYLSLD